MWLACCPTGNLHSVALKICEMIKAICQINESVRRPQAGAHHATIARRQRLRLLVAKVTPGGSFCLTVCSVHRVHVIKQAAIRGQSRRMSDPGL